jgi:hypothetical protein
MSDPIRHEVTNRITGKVTSYKTLDAALRACTRMNRDYGAGICTRKPIYA